MRTAGQAAVPDDGQSGSLVGGRPWEQQRDGAADTRGFDEYIQLASCPALDSSSSDPLHSSVSTLAPPTPPSLPAPDLPSPHHNLKSYEFPSYLDKLIFAFPSTAPLVRLPSIDHGLAPPFSDGLLLPLRRGSLTDPLLHAHSTASSGASLLTSPLAANPINGSTSSIYENNRLSPSHPSLLAAPGSIDRYWHPAEQLTQSHLDGPPQAPGDYSWPASTNDNEPRRLSGPSLNGFPKALFPQQHNIAKGLPPQKRETYDDSEREFAYPSPYRPNTAEQGAYYSQQPLPPSQSASVLGKRRASLVEESKIDASAASRRNSRSSSAGNPAPAFGGQQQQTFQGPPGYSFPVASNAAQQSSQYSQQQEAVDLQMQDYPYGPADASRESPRVGLGRPPSDSPNSAHMPGQPQQGGPPSAARLGQPSSNGRLGPGIDTKPKTLNIFSGAGPTASSQSMESHDEDSQGTASTAGKAASSLADRLRLQHVKDSPYSRSPELKVSHKIAERKRRKEMKELFDDLRDSIPGERGMKASKWEVLSKAIDYIAKLQEEKDEVVQALTDLRAQVEEADASGYGPGAGQPMEQEKATLGSFVYPQPPTPHQQHAMMPEGASPVHAHQQQPTPPVVQQMQQMHHQQQPQPGQNSWHPGHQSSHSQPHLTHHHSHSQSPAPSLQHHHSHGSSAPPQSGGGGANNHSGSAALISPPPGGHISPTYMEQQQQGGMLPPNSHLQVHHAHMQPQPPQPTPLQHQHSQHSFGSQRPPSMHSHSSNHSIHSVHSAGGGHSGSPLVSPAPSNMPLGVHGQQGQYSQQHGHHMQQHYQQPQPMRQQHSMDDYQFTHGPPGPQQQQGSY